jgi:glycosyltransferase involved in cell wall biosynthesis
MKISIVTGPFLSVPPGRSGSVERRWYYVAHLLSAMGHDVTVVSKCAEDGGSAVFALVPAGGNGQRMSGPNVKTVKGYNRSGSLVWDVVLDFLYAWRCVRLKVPADVVVANTFWLPILLTLGRVRTKIVIDVARVPKWQLAMYWKASCFRVASGVVEKTVLKQAPWLRNRTLKLANPIDTKVFCPAAKENCDESYVLLYAGRIHPEKGLHLLVMAAKRMCEARPHANISLKIVGVSETADGGGGMEYVNELRKLAEHLAVSIDPPIYDRLAFSAVLRKATVFCYPSVAERGESFGVAPLEAMACGAVPVVSALECFREFISHGRNGLVFDHRKDAVAELTHQLLWLYDNPERRKELRQQGEVDAAEFGFEHFAACLDAKFQELVRS